MQGDRQNKTSNNLGRIPSANSIQYLNTRQTQQQFEVYFTKHLRALLFLYYQRISAPLKQMETEASLSLQQTSPYHQLNKKQLQLHFLQRNQLQTQYEKLVKVFKNYELQLNDKEDFEALEDLKKCVYLALALKRKSKTNQLKAWDQSNWGNIYYPQIIKNILQKIIHLKKEKNEQSIRNENYRKDFLNSLYTEAITFVENWGHSSLGLACVIQDEIYCFVASFYNFSQNQRYIQKANAVHAQKQKAASEKASKSPQKKQKTNQK